MRVARKEFLVLPGAGKAAAAANFTYSQNRVNPTEPHGPSSIDAARHSVYSGLFLGMPIKKIQIGQVWKKDDTGDSYLVTKVYNEALATFAVLRKAGSETDAPLRIRVSLAGGSQTLAGFRFSQESEEF